jgi:hypothetical protein
MLPTYVHDEPSTEARKPNNLAPIINNRGHPQKNYKIRTSRSSDHDQEPGGSDHLRDQDEVERTHWDGSA